MGKKTFVNFSKDIWKYLLEYQIMVTAEYFPSQLNAEANWQSRSCKEPSEYKLCPKVFQQIYQWRETPQLDLFVSRHSQQPSQDKVSMQNRTIQPRNRQLSLNIKQQSPLLVSSIFSYSSSFQKSRPGSDGNDIASHNNLPVTILVPTFNENASSSTITSSQKYDL